MDELTKLCRNTAMITRVIDGEAVIMDPQNGKVMALNEVGSLIWELLDGTHNKKAILDEIIREFDVDREQAAVDLEDFLVVLRSKDLLA
ncbi:PqqD family protein [Phosphitispora sp. TUW77]|uniref:PqqD family protein n=1 Tax=Phosphitispora sp. TUW77 TaxID=3152361 RepID=UPI003AB76F7E